MQNNLYSRAHSFLNKILSEIETQKIEIHNKEIDHLCYRTSSNQNYHQIKREFESLGSLLIESEVNGRMIATYKLHKPITYKNWIIDLVEVPAPKPNKQTQEGFEHIEVVIDCSFDEFKKNLPHIKFNEKGMSKDLNPELEIEFVDCAIKFHHKSLEHIINIEKNSKIMTFLNDTGILNKFKQFSPCISGTLPLGIQRQDSDLDILFCADDLQEFLDHAKSVFQNESGFHFQFSQNQGLESLVINFEYLGLPIELFAQDCDSFQQRANQHFLIEGRLLKVLGSSFCGKVCDLKQQGIKTEPAFAQILNLDEPYQDLVDLNQLSDAELLSRFSD